MDGLRSGGNSFGSIISIPDPDHSPLNGLDSLTRVTLKTRAGDSLTRLLAHLGVQGSEQRQWLRSIQKDYPSKGLLPGREMSLYFTKSQFSLSGTSAKEHIKALEIELNDDWISTWERGNRGIVYSKREKPYDVELKSIASVVEDSPLNGGLRPALNPALVSQLADIFNWEVDFNKNLQKGDMFRLLYEERTRKGPEKKTTFHIVAAELINAGQKFFAIYFEKEKGKGNYYDLDGRSLARAFLRFPLEFASISSQFSHSRYNPILKIDVPHHGVDFVAKRGTPVRAVGDGKITFAGWKEGGYGRLVEIQHDSTYTSRYAHLQAVARGIRHGTTVQKGQIIGYVGSSGRSTGAHLHFELYEDQQYVDPLNFEIPPEDKIESALQRVFDSTKQVFLARLAATPTI